MSKITVSINSLTMEKMQLQGMSMYTNHPVYNIYIYIHMQRKARGYRERYSDREKERDGFCFYFRHIIEIEFGCVSSPIIIYIFAAAAAVAGSRVCQWDRAASMPNYSIYFYTVSPFPAVHGYRIPSTRTARWSFEYNYTTTCI